MDYCCNPQCFVCGGTVNPPHDLVYLLIYVFGDIIFFFYILINNKMTTKRVAWWQRAWDLHSKSWVRVRVCISCKSLGQPRFYSLTWAYKVRFPGGGVSSNPKTKWPQISQNHKNQHYRRGIFLSFFLYGKIIHMPLSLKKLTLGIRGDGVF